MAASMEKMNQLMKRKDELEGEIKALNEVLDSQQDVGLSGPLVDSEGFPRADIDVYSVRHARHEIICLQNDHKALMADIEEELYKIHAEARAQKSQTEEMSESESTDNMEVADDRLPFASVEKVDSGSPADTAVNNLVGDLLETKEQGLKPGDAVLCFGSITKENFQTLQNIVTVLQHSKGKSLPVTVRRGQETVNLSLVPQTWAGKGLLGCKITPNG